MAKYVFRTDLRQRPVGEPLYGIDATELFFRPDMRTIEQCVVSLLREDEICLGVSDRRAIMQGPKIVGYIRVVEEFNWITATLPHAGTDGR